MSDPTVILLLEADYMANLLDEELCSDGPLSDLCVKKVSQTSGTFRVEMEMKPEKADAA